MPHHDARLRFSSFLAATALTISSFGCKTASVNDSKTLADNAAQPATSVRLLRWNPDAWATRWKMIESAERSIVTHYYIINDDIWGMAYLAAILHKIKTNPNLTVDLMVDARGTKNLSKKGLGQGYLQELVTAGQGDGGESRVRVRVYNPSVASEEKVRSALKRFWDSTKNTTFTQLFPKLFDEVMSGQSANHDKILIVDGRYTVTGGRNIGVDYFSDQTKDITVYDDCDIYVDSSSVAESATKAFHKEFDLSRNFEVKDPRIPILHRDGKLDRLYEILKAATDAGDLSENDRQQIAKVFPDFRAQLAAISLNNASMPATLKYTSVSTPSATDVVLLDNASNLHDEEIAKTLATRHPDNAELSRKVLDLIKGAQKRVWLFNPYVVITAEMDQALKAATARGVELRLISNSAVSTDSYLTQAIFNSEWPQNLKDYPTMRIFANRGPAKMHAKYLLVDDEHAVVSSYNLDYISQNTNSEIAVYVRSKDFTTQLANDFNTYLSTKTVEYTAKDGVLRGAEQIDSPTTPAAIKKVKDLYPIAKQLREKI